MGLLGDVAEWLRSGLQSRVHRFDSGRRLSPIRAAARRSSRDTEYWGSRGAAPMLPATRPLLRGVCMMRSRSIRAVICALALMLAGAISASAGQPQGPPPPPTATNGNPVETLAQGVPTPTQFAFGAGKVFVAAAGSEDGSTPGGVFVVENGTATRLAGSPPFAFGVAWRDGTLYVSSGPQIHAWSSWN